MTSPRDMCPDDLKINERVRDIGAADVFAEIGRRLAAHPDTTSALEALTLLTVDTIVGARWVSVTRGSTGRFVTMASSDPVASHADALQYRLGTGPCVDAVVEDTVFESRDLARDRRWSTFGPQAAAECGTRSVLSVRLPMEGDVDAALNIYGDRVEAFDESDRHLAVLLATHAAIAVAAVMNREVAQQLQGALDSNREIGVAMGVLMNSLKLTREQSFELLQMVSQRTNRKLRDVASDIAETGELPAVPQRRRLRSKPGL